MHWHVYFMVYQTTLSQKQKSTKNGLGVCHNNMLQLIDHNTYTVSPLATNVHSCLFSKRLGLKIILKPLLKLHFLNR